MTCIIGIAHDNVVTMIADSCASDEVSQRTLKHPKIWRDGEFLIGTAGSLALGLKLRHGLIIPEHEQGLSDTEYMNTDFLDAIRDVINPSASPNECVGTVETILHDFQGIDLDIIVGYRGNLYHIADDTVLEYADNIVCIGSGADFALGAMLALSFLDCEERVTEAIEIAAKLAIGVTAPFHLETLTHK